MDTRLSIIFLVALAQISLQKDTVKVSVYYESYCPDSIDFFVKQLTPAWDKFKDAIKLDLVPYGFATQEYKNGHWHFTCQHGVKECIGNILHACAINKLITSKNQQYNKLVHFINCVMKTPDQEMSAKKCSKENKINYKPIKHCEHDKQGENLESGYGNRTQNFTPQFTWVPTAVFNDVFNQGDQDEAMTNLQSVICKYIPNNKHCGN